VLADTRLIYSWLTISLSTVRIRRLLLADAGHSAIYLSVSHVATTATASHRRAFIYYTSACYFDFHFAHLKAASLFASAL